MSREVANGPPRFAFASRRYVAIASITESGTCVPPGPSKNASGRCSAVKRARTASIGGHDTCHSYLGFTASDAPTKQSRSPFAIRSSGSFVRGVSCTSIRRSIATKR